MKKIIANKKVIMSFMMLVVCFSFLFLTGCQNNSSIDDGKESQNASGIEYPITEGTTFFVGNIHIASKSDLGWFDTEGSGIPVTFVGTALYYLPKDIKDYDKYYELLKGDSDSGYNILKYFIDYELKDPYFGAYPIIRVEIPNEEEYKEALEDYEDSFEENKTRSTTSLSSSMSLSQASSFFTQFENMSCNLLLSNPCIPFQFAADGCYARAHYMRKLMADAGYDCQKIFVRSEQSGKFLQANTRANCCQCWSWHVAPLVTTPSGQRVIDPSLCTAPVTITTWLNTMKSSCYSNSLQATNISYSIQAASVYRYYSGTEYDNNYTKTYTTMDAYSLLQGCSNWLLS